MTVMNLVSQGAYKKLWIWRVCHTKLQIALTIFIIIHISFIDNMIHMIHMSWLRTTNIKKVMAGLTITLILRVFSSIPTKLNTSNSLIFWQIQRMKGISRQFHFRGRFYNTFNRNLFAKRDCFGRVISQLVFFTNGLAD